MELPKNTIQVGEVGRDYRVYVEDYAVSYLKQLNRLAENKKISASLYGNRSEEAGISYYFVYGAAKLDFLQQETRHLSQAQIQEIERLKREYFPGMEFLGYRVLDGEMIEGFHICDQGICRYLPGYAQFYEKNDAMLGYMLETREESKPEVVDQDKYIEVKKRQKERKEENSQKPLWNTSVKKLKLAAAGIFALFCIYGFSSIYSKSLPPEAVETSGQPGITTDRLTMEDKLEQAILNENAASILENAQPSLEETSKPEESGTPESAPAPDGQETASQTAKEDGEATAAITDPASSESQSMNVSSQSTVTRYRVKTGDTLLGICLKQYGSDRRLLEICEINAIEDPNDIKEGQTLLLP